MFGCQVPKPPVVAGQSKGRPLSKVRRLLCFLGFDIGGGGSPGRIEQVAKRLADCLKDYNNRHIDYFFKHITPMKAKTLGQRLKEERKRLGLVQTAFAEIGGVKRVTQHLYEQDVRTPDCSYLLSLKEAGLDVVYVLLGRRYNADGVDLELNTLANIYRAIDEVARDSSGEPLSIDERTRLYTLLVSALSGEQTQASIDELRKKLLRWSRMVA